ncbi:MAG: AmmeMemoRadiSam system protein A [Candidatus Sumerlaeia bacterium]
MSEEKKLLDASCQKALVEVAWAAIEASVRDTAGYDLDCIDEAIGRNPALADPRAAFTTVYVNQELRGCLGEIRAEDPVARVVARCAWRAARLDPRFDPVRPDELARLDFKLSILTPSRRIHSPAEIVIGRDGLLIEHDYQRGLLLPDVASEHGWDVPTFLAHLYRKAGIDPSVPLGETRLSAFETQIIDSHDF